MTIFNDSPQDMEFDSSSDDERLATIAADKPFPYFTVRRYAHLAAKQAVIEETEVGTFFGRIDGFSGVWAEGESAETVIAELADVVYGWAVLKIEDQDRDLPIVADINLNVI